MRLEQPGDFPYTRGIHAHMYQGKLLTMRQYSGFGTVNETNRRLRELVAQGQTGLSIAFDLPTQLGLDSDDPMAEGEVGKTGAAVSSVEDMELLLKGLPVQSMSISKTMNSAAPAILAMYLCTAERSGAAATGLLGTMQNDPLKEFAARGTYVYPPEASVKLAVDVMEYCFRYVPRYYPVSVCGYHMREAGANAVQELAFTLLHAVCYLDELRSRGIDLEFAASRFTFFFSTGLQLLEEVAKFRAARRLWAKLLQERYGLRSPKALQLRFHAQTAGSELTVHQLDNNVARVALQALAAIYGGAQSLHTNAKDEAQRLPTRSTAGTALMPQQLIAWETDAAAVPDPMGGSYYVEAMTERLEEEAAALLKALLAEGGALAALQSGTTQRALEAGAIEAQRRLEQGTRRQVGMGPDAPPLAGVPTRRRLRAARGEPTEARLAALQRLRSRRDNAAVTLALRDLAEDASAGANVMPAFLAAARAQASLGEMTRVLTEIYGEAEGDYL